MNKKIINIFYKILSYKTTCDCCGYKSLNSNDMGEICPICYWEQDYFHPNDQFCMSSANYMTLYQAQENYNNFGSHKRKFISRCRGPLKNEIKDKDWVSIQDKIESKYPNNKIILPEIKNICLRLRNNEAETLFYNYKELDATIGNKDDELTSYYYLGESDDAYVRLCWELLLRSLSIILVKRDPYYLLEQVNLCYKKGVSYYISWSIMLSVLIKTHNKKINPLLTDLLLDIENNNYYGLKYLENDLKEYWRSFRGGSSFSEFQNI